MSFTPSDGPPPGSRFEIRRAERQLWVEGSTARLGARAFDVLLALYDRRDRPVPKHELLDVAWRGVVVEENNLQVQISTLRKLLGRGAITTIPGRGYQFTAGGGAGTGAVGDLTRDAAGPPAASTKTPIAGNLPDDLPPLFGRSRDLATLGALLDEHRLVSIVGAAGIGKTALAQALTHGRRAAFSDGVWLIELAPIGDAALVLPAVADPLELPLGADAQPKDLAERLRGANCLLVLDNCEHLLHAVAELAQALLRHAPGVRVVVTSQEPLKLADEYVHRLDALALPVDADAADARSAGAVALFEARARAADSRVEIDERNLPTVIDICRQLDGLPLAIELAAARVPLLGIDGLQARLGERLRLLTAGHRLALRRHQTLRAALEWSHALLTPEEQAVFRRLGVFVGGFSLELAQHVAEEDGLDSWEVLDALASLVDKSMIVAEGGDRLRYRLLDTMRAFALAELRRNGETARAQQRHAHAVCERFLRTEEERFGEQGTLGGTAFAERLVPEIDNVRAALDWASSDPDRLPTAVALAGASALVFPRRGATQEALRRMLTFRPRIDAVPDQDHVALFWQGLGVLGANGRLPIADVRTAWDNAQRHYRERKMYRRLHYSLCGLARALSTTGASDAAEALLADIAQIERPAWPAWIRANRLASCAHAYYHQRRFEDSLAMIREEKSVLATQPDGQDYALACDARLCHALNCLQRYEEARALAESVLARNRAQPSILTSFVLMHLMDAQLLQGRIEDAAATMQRALAGWRRNDMVFFCCVGMATLLAEQGRFADAARLNGVEPTVLTRIPSRPGTTRLRERTLKLFEQAKLDPRDIEAWRREGAALDEAQIAAVLTSVTEGSQAHRLALEVSSASTFAAQPRSDLATE